jgi:hypothetical protein
MAMEYVVPTFQQHTVLPLLVPMVTKASIENSKGFSYHDDYQGPQIINKRESFETCGWIGHALDEASGWFFSQVINFLRCIMIGDSVVILSTLAVEKEVSVGTKVSISSAGTNLMFFLKQICMERSTKCGKLRKYWTVCMLQV